MKISALLSILTLYSVFITSSVRSHECQHHKRIGQAQLIPEHMMEHKWGKRNLQQKNGPLRITFDRSSLNNLQNQPLTDRINRLLDYLRTYVSELLHVNQLDTNKYIIQRNCDGINISDEMRNVGVPDSDLHIFIKISNTTEPYLAAATACQLIPRCTFGSIEINIYNFVTSLTERSYNYQFNSLLHETVHLLGFSIDILPYFLNQNGNFYYYTQFLEQTIRGFQTPILTLPKLTEQARKIYNCPSITGMQLENQGSFGTMYSHFEQTISLYELMGPSTSMSIPSITNLTLAVLDDSNFYTYVNYTMASPHIFANNTGCDFFNNACQSNQTKYSQFCYDAGATKCDNYRTAMSDCVYSQYSDKCNIYLLKSDYDCTDSSTVPIDSVKIGDAYGTNSRCFDSNIKLDKLNRYGLYGRCYKYNCNSNGSLSVYIASYELVCTDKDQILIGPTGTGTIICPDISKLCSQNFICPHYCSQRGACINGACQCYDGYSGKSCQCFPGSVPDSSDNCVCPKGQANNGTSCVNCSPNCLDCSNNLYCNQCADGYKISGGNGACTKCSDGQFEQVQGNQSQCVACSSICSQCSGSDSFCIKCPTSKYLLRSTGTCQTRCPLGYYENTSLMECIACNISSCQSCNSGPNVCDSCQNDLFLSYNLIQCTASCQSTEYSTTNNITSNGKSIQAKKCMPCSLTCIACYGADKANCTKCSTATYLSNNTCVSTCPSGTYPDTVNRVCQQCTLNCLTCTSQNTCSQCSLTTYILKQPISQTDSTLKTTCISSCPLTTFKVDAIPLQSILAECKSCISNCATCTTTSDCQSCSTGYFMVSTGQSVQCVSQCPNANQLVDSVNIVAYYTDISTSQCIKCLENCGLCSDSSSCTMCKAGYARLRISGKSDQCLSSCPTNYTLNSSNRICQKCIDNCNSCDSSYLNKCIQCQSNYYILKGNTSNDADICLQSCPTTQGYFQDVFQCSKCQQNCQQCSSLNLCQICSSQTYLYTESTTGNQNCVSTCPDGYYAAQNSTTNICVKCLDNCTKCQNKTTCITCLANYSLYSQPTQSDQCLQTCPSGSYHDTQSQNCKQCLTNCSICSNNTICDNCSSTYVRLRIQNQPDLCLQQCLSGFYQLGNECKQCIEGCQVCKDNKVCQQCKTPLIILPIGFIDGQANDNCIAKCPNGFFTSTTNDVSLGNIDKCDKCITNCISCKNNTTCEQCSQNYFNLKVQNQNDLCLPTCPLGYFANTQTGQCQQCLDGCADCSSKGSNGKKCYLCSSGHYLIQLQEADQCLIHCPTQNYFQNEQTKTCEPCKTQYCGVCSSTSSSFCDSCSPNYFLLKSLNSQQIDQCVTDCPTTKYYKDLSVLICQPCSDNCLYCNNKQECTTCIDGFYLNDTGFYLNDKVCVQSCPQYKYINTQTKKCENCLSNCIQCSSSSRCLACDTNFFLYQGVNQDECRLVCGITLYENSITQKCDNCIQNCDKCSTGSDCIKCKNGFNLYQISQNTFQCVSVCPQKTYSQNQICKSCLQNCQSCLSNISCSVCSSGFNLILASTSSQIQSTEYSTISDTCISASTSCPMKTYLDVSAKECKQCQSDCKNCVNSQYCNICQDPYILFTQTTQNGKVTSCQNYCPTGYFIEIVNSNQQPFKRCSNCLQNCAECQNEDTCSSCINSYSLLTKSEYLLQNPSTENPDQIIDQCLSNCPEKFFFNQEKKECDGCSNNCLICASEQQCQQCFNNYFLLNDKEKNSQICVQNCPTQFYFEDKQQWICDECDIQNCEICSESPQSCFKCNDGYYFYKLTNQILQGQCLKNCPPFFYADQQQKLCMPCPPGCLNCSSSTHCNQCESQLILLSSSLSNQNIDECLSNCPISFYSLFNEEENHKICNKCIQECEKCSNDLTCEQCQKGYYLLIMDGLHQCVPGCPLSYYYLNEQNQSCQQCLQGCEICQNSYTCAKCTEDFILFNLKDDNGRYIGDQCITECPQNKYYIYHDQQNTLCKECDINNCLTCPSSSNCTQCEEGYYLLNENGNKIKCVQNCPSGYFKDNQTEQCKKCLQNCSKCQNNTECQVCKPWLTLQSHLYIKEIGIEVCSDNCPEGYYKSEDEQYDQYICMPCSENCQICSSPLTCSQCQFNYSLLSRILVHSHADQCIQYCPTGFISYEETLDNGDNIQKCVSCSSNCIECSTPFGQSVWTNQIESLLNIQQQNHCRECSTGYLKYTSPSNQYEVSCVNICPEYYFADDFNQICQQCQDGCKSCQNQDMCLKCQEGMFLIDVEGEEGQIFTQCSNSCPDQHYKDIQSNQCINCMENCIQCINSQTCIKCDGNYLLTQEGKCQQQCGESQYKENNECKPCSVNCQECESSNVCIKCKNQYLLLEQKITLNDSIFNQQVCIQSCPISYFTSNNSVVDPNQNSRCLQCLPNCTSCINEVSCYFCNSQFYLFQRNLVTPQLDSDLCLNNCPEKFYKDLTSFQCKKCSDNCNTCQNNQICTVCSISHYIISYNDSSNGCLAKCPPSYYPESNNGQLICEKCDQRCSICTDKFLCKECSQNFYLYIIDDKNQSCVNTCPSSYYKSIDSFGIKSCKKCGVDNCSTCFENQPDSCQQCSTSYYLIQASTLQNQVKDLCIQTCPLGTYKEEGNIQQCRVCPTNCQVCSDSIKCQICNSSYYLLQNYSGTPTQCVNKCPNGYFLNPSLNQCEQCTDQNCQDCSNNLRCKDCISPYKLLISEEIDQPDQCITMCPNGHYEKQINQNQSDNNQTNSTNLSSDVICDKCPINCIQCKDNKTCLKCDTGFGLLEGECLSTIPPQHYLLNGNILQCLSNCLMCDDGVSCQACIQSYYLLQKLGQSSQCIQNCPNQYYKSNSTQSCEHCLSNCENCTNQTNCSQCSQNYYLYENNGTYQCLMSCPSQYYADNISRKCLQCSPQCTECSNSTNCSKCLVGFKLLKQNQSNSCVSNCPQFYRQTSTDCISCSNNCAVCQENESVCQSCQKGYYLSKIDFNCYPCSNSQLACDECSQQLKYKQYLTMTNYQCLDKCLDGFYENINPQTNEYTCKQCQTSGCRKCSSLSCLVCFSSTPYMMNGNCLESCPQFGYYDTIVKNVVQGQSFDQHVCQKCQPSNCQQCNSSGDSCLVCTNNFFLYKSQCVQNCPIGTRADSTLKQCIDCSIKNCSNCQTSVSSCDTCYSLFYFNTLSQLCQPCIVNCLQCTGVNQCSTCVNGYFFDVIQLACVTQCLPGYYKDISNNTCQKCNSACKTCQGPNSTDCLQCNNLYYSQQSQGILQSITCLEGCGPGRVRRTQLPYQGLVDECQPCYKGCSKCYDVFNTQCLSCFDGYTLIKNSCYNCAQVNCSLIT